MLNKVFIFIKRCQADIVKEGTTEQQLEDELDVPPPELECLDAKISTAIDAVATGGIAADIAILVDRYCDMNPTRRLTGRRKLRVITKDFRSNARRAGLYSIADAQAVKLLCGPDVEPTRSSYVQQAVEVLRAFRNCRAAEAGLDLRSGLLIAERSTACSGTVPKHRSIRHER